MAENKMRQVEIDKLFSDERFEGEKIETVFASTSNRDRETVRLVVIVYPMDDMLRYRIDVGGETMAIYSNFKGAIDTFRRFI
jgi:hypothetical protein